MSRTLSRSPWMLGLLAAGLGVVYLARRDGGRPGPAVKRPNRSNMPSLTHHRGIEVARTVTIARPVDELYAFWRNFQNLPRLMPSLLAVTPIAPGRWHWVAVGPADSKIEWDTEVVADRDDEVIAWRTVGDPDIEHGGSVRFTPAPGGRGTEVKLILHLAPPLGRLGQLIAAAFGQHPDREIREALRRFKQLMEAGEMPTTEAQPSARRAA